MSFSPFLWGWGEVAIAVGTVEALRRVVLAGDGTIHLFAVEKYINSIHELLYIKMIMRESDKTK